jgi:uncharacterized protein
VSFYFLDSSALVKRYVTESGSSWIESVVSAEAGNTIFIARITWVEVFSALSRRQREERLTAD